LLSCGQSDSHNLKYMGIDALGRLIKLSPHIAEQHQLAVIDCLEVRDVPHKDEFIVFFDKIGTFSLCVDHSMLFYFMFSYPVCKCKPNHDQCC